MNVFRQLPPNFPQLTPRIGHKAEYQKAEFPKGEPYRPNIKRPNLQKGRVAKKAEDPKAESLTNVGNIFFCG